MLDTKQASLVLQVVPLCQAILYWQTIRILPKILQPLKGIVDYHSFFAALTALKISKRRRELGNSDFIPLTITPGSSRLWFWEIRQCGPPSEDIIAHAGDIYLDMSTVPIDVYQNASTGWTLCWSEPSCVLNRIFLKLPHPYYKDRFLWTTETTSKGEILLSYISLEELNSRCEIEEIKQAYLLRDFIDFSPIIEEDLCDDGEEEDTDNTILSAEVEMIPLTGQMKTQLSAKSQRLQGSHNPF